MEVLALSILILSGIIGFIALFFTTFGTLIIFIGALLFAFMTDFSAIGIKTLIFLFTLYACGEALEYILVAVGVKKVGSSNAAIVGALIGGIIGSIAGAMLLGVNIIVGTFLGIFLGAFIVEFFIHKDVVKSIRAGAGGLLGRLSSIVVKVIIAIIMFLIMAQSIIASSGSYFEYKSDPVNDVSFESVSL